MQNKMQFPKQKQNKPISMGLNGEAVCFSYPNLFSCLAHWGRDETNAISQKT